MTVQKIKRAGKKLQLLDVRSPDEWKKEHIPQREKGLPSLPRYRSTNPGGSDFIVCLSQFCQGKPLTIHKMHVPC